jgi:hypothetical protein
MKEKRLIPKAWMTLRLCCGSEPVVSYDPGMDVTMIQCEQCGLFAVNCYDHQVIKAWNRQIGLITEEPVDDIAKSPLRQDAVCR